MPEEVRAVAWDAFAHHYFERKNDWFWIMGIAIVTIATISVFFGNTLLGILILIGGTVMLILASRPPQIVAYSITQRGLRIDDKLYPYTTLESYDIDEDHELGPQLLLKSEKMFMPMIAAPIPEEYIDEIELIVGAKLPEAQLEEPFAHKLLEIFGF